MQFTLKNGMVIEMQAAVAIISITRSIYDQLSVHYQIIILIFKSKFLNKLRPLGNNHIFPLVVYVRSRLALASSEKKHVII